MADKNSGNSLFGHVFESGGTSYYYDVPSQEIVALDPVLAAVIPCFEQCQKGDIPQHLSSRFKNEEILKAIQVLERAEKEDGLFSPKRPQLVQAPNPTLSPGNYDSNLRHLVLTLTENCNLRCGYCLHGASLDWVRPHGNRTMSSATAMQATRYFLDRCSTSEVPAVSFYGGEALLQAGLIDKVSQEVRGHPLGRDAHLVIDTNGVLLDPEALDMVVRNQMHLQISLDGPRDYHDRQRSDLKGMGTFDRIMNALDLLLGMDATAHERLTFICTIAPPVDLSVLDGFFKNFPPFARNGITTEPTLRVNLANLKDQDWPATPEDFHDLSKQLKQVRESYFQALASGQRDNLGPVFRGLVEPGLFRLHHRSKAPLGDEFIPGGNCQPGIRKLHVTVDGRFQPCERTGDLLELGHANNGIDVAAVDKLQQGFFDAVQSRCGQCWALRLCGVCYAGWAEHGQGEILPESVCHFTRRNAEEDLKLLVRILELPETYRGYLDEVSMV
jgi:uncharacterized protein